MSAEGATIHTGGCLCGAVKFRIAAEPVAVRTCWCRLCQYLGAGSATVNAIFPSQACEVEGETTAIDGLADSGAVSTRRFCPKCGTPLFSQSAARRHQIAVRVGALDHPERYAPKATIWVEKAPPWAAIDDSLPKVVGQPPPAT